MSYIQPQFIKFNSNTNLPEKLNGKYMLYYDFGYYDTTGIGAIYVELESVDKLAEFLKSVYTNKNILLTGNSSFILNTDYYLNKTLYSCLNDLSNGSTEDSDYFIEEELSDMKIDEGSNSSDSDDKVEYLPDYILSDITVDTTYFDEVDNDSELFTYLLKKNSYLNYEFSEEELMNFYSTFCKVILDLTTYTATTTQDLIYKQTLEYFKNFKSDDTSIGVSLILGNLYAVSSSSTTSCGCTNSAVTGDTQCTQSCISYYTSALTEYLKSMLGNSDFYTNWFFIHEEGVDDVVNTELVERLKTLINEFLELGLDLSLSSSTSNSCNCPTVDTSGNDCNVGILKNYIKVLGYVSDETIEENTNKIKVYGQTFGELLPNLQF